MALYPLMPDHMEVDRDAHGRIFYDYPHSSGDARTMGRINEGGEQREALIAKRGRIQSYLDTLNQQKLIAEFDEVLWYGTMDQVGLLSGDIRLPAGHLSPESCGDRWVSSFSRLSSFRRSP